MRMTGERAITKGWWTGLACVICVLVVTGCGKPLEALPETVEPLEGFIRCDVVFGVQYVYYRHGISVRLDRQGRPVPCPKEGESQ